MKRSFRAEDSVIIFLLGFVLYQIVGFVLVATMNTESDAYIFLAYAVPQITYIATVLVYVKVRKTEFRLLPQKEDVKLLDYPIVIAIALGLFFFALLPNYGVQRLFALMGKSPTVTLPDLTKPLNIALGVFVICLLPAIGEELLFRKVFIDGFKRYGAVEAIVLSGVLFGLSHLNLAQTVHQIFLGCVLSYIYLKTKNITLTAVIHFINNLLALYLTLFTGEEAWNNLTVLGIAFAVGLVIFASGLIYIIKRTPKIEKKEKEKLSLFTVGLIVFVAVLWIITAVLS